MELTEARKKYIFTTRVDYDEKEYVILREPTLAEAKDFGEDTSKNVEILEKIFPGCVIETSITVGDIPAIGKQVYDVLKDSASLFSEILGIWFNSIPFGSRIAKNKK